jgi:arsenate reductase (thioredoxin)
VLQASWMTPGLRAHLDRVAIELATDFAGTFSPETIERYMDGVLPHFEDATVLAFVPTFVHRYTRDRLRAVAIVEGKLAKDRPEVLFVCVRNAGRSQIAAALLDHHAEGRVHVTSAGSAPASEIHPGVREALAERGLDVTKAFPKPLADDLVAAADVVITMGCGDACPVYPGIRYADWDVQDPGEAAPDEVRAIVDEIDARVRALLDDLLTPAPTAQA